MRFLYALLLVLALSPTMKAEPISYDLFRVQEVTANRLIVVTEPSWCIWCVKLDPHLKTLKKEGYDVHEYTQAEWKKAKPKPTSAPKIKSVPTVMYVEVSDKVNKVNKVVKTHGGGEGVTAEHIKKYLLK